MDDLTKQKILEDILPILQKTIELSPQYGEISIRAKICNFKVGTTVMGIEEARKTTKNIEGEQYEWKEKFNL